MNFFLCDLFFAYYGFLFHSILSRFFSHFDRIECYTAFSSTQRRFLLAIIVADCMSWYVCCYFLFSIYTLVFDVFWIILFNQLDDFLRAYFSFLSMDISEYFISVRPISRRTLGVPSQIAVYRPLKLFQCAILNNKYKNRINIVVSKVFKLIPQRLSSDIHHSLILRLQAG